MNLSEAFKGAVRKYYEGYDFPESKNLGTESGEFSYDFDTLEEMRAELGKPKKRAYTKRADRLASIMDEEETEEEEFE